MRVSVIGSGTVGPGDLPYEHAREVGRRLGERGHDIVCGGLQGVMAAACQGGRDADAHTIGILPGADPRAANEYVETAVATNMGNARNVLVVLNGRAVIAVSGATGTLSELGHALDIGRPVAGLDTHTLDAEGLEPVATPRAAVDYIEQTV